MNHGSAINVYVKRILPDTNQIEEKRIELFQTAKLFGMYSNETLRCSQELDALIASAQQSCFPI
ncbi:MAG: aspartyl-phosphate phosphatase Spo0E family protein [Sporolactobacillus sp.]